MLKKIMATMIVPVLGIALVAAAASTTPGGEKCCCIVNDAGQLVCTITGEVLDTCCCE